MSAFILAQAQCEPGGWSDAPAPTPSEIRRAEKRWADRSYQHRLEDEGGTYQCGGCAFFAATGSDYGICWNERSPLDGMVTFEHGGCPEHSSESPPRLLARPATPALDQLAPAEPSGGMVRGEKPRRPLYQPDSTHGATRGPRNTAAQHDQLAIGEELETFDEWVRGLRAEGGQAR